MTAEPGGRCSWCGAPATRWVTIEPAALGVVNGRKVAKYPAKQARACDSCAAGFERRPPSLQREVDRQRSASWGQLQGRLF